MSADPEADPLFDEERIGFHVRADARALAHAVAALGRSSPTFERLVGVGMRRCRSRRGEALLLSHESFVDLALCCRILRELSGAAPTVNAIPEVVVVPTDAGPLRVQLGAALRRRLLLTRNGSARAARGDAAAIQTPP